MWDLEARKISCSLYNARESWKLSFKCGLLWPHGERSSHTFRQLFTPFAKRPKTTKQRIHRGSFLPDREASGTLYNAPEASALINCFRLREAMKLARLGSKENLPKLTDWIYCELLLITQRHNENMWHQRVVTEFRATRTSGIQENGSGNIQEAKVTLDITK